MFVLVCDIDDIKEEVREKAELLKKEFLKRYRNNLANWTGEISVFQGIDDYVEENIFIPPKILLVGEPGVGKSTIMNLFPGENIIHLDDDFNEIIQKPINVTGLDIKQFILREININDLIDNSKHYRSLLNSVDVICLVTNCFGAFLPLGSIIISQMSVPVSGDIVSPTIRYPPSSV